MLKKIISNHNKKAYIKRINTLAESISDIISDDEKMILDVGAFSGELAYKISKKKKIKIIGIDTHLPKKRFISVKKYDGVKFPFDDKSFDCVLLIDVLHHTKDMDKIINEAKRVARKSIIIKDHTYTNKFNKLTLLSVDYLGNKVYGIDTPLKFLRISEWNELFRRNKLRIDMKDYDYRQKRFDIIKHILIKLRKNE